MIVLYILAALLLLGIMVTVHEAGHFFAARLCGIPVKQFSIGFGPKLAKWKSKKHETTYILRLIPAGGFCMFYGEDEAEGVQKDDPRNLGNFSVPKRMLTIAMGPIMNFVLAFIVCFAFYQITGAAYGRAQVMQVDAGGAAAEAGIRAGDMIERVNGQDASGVDASGNSRVSELIDSYRPDGEPLTITVSRGQEQLELSVAPRVDETGRMLIGVNLTFEIVRLPVFQTMGVAFRMCVAQGSAILSGLRDLIFKGQGLDQMAGPVGVVTLIAQQTQSYGLEAYIALLVFISVNLGLVNLLPIPGLDGSRILFLVVEAIRRKPMNQKVEAYIHLAGFGLFILLFVVLTWQDITRLF